MYKLYRCEKKNSKKVCCTLFLYRTVQTVHLTQTLELYTTEQWYAFVAVHKILKAKKNSRNDSFPPPRLSQCSDGPGGGQLSACVSKTLKLSSSHSPPKRLSPGGEEPLPGSGQSFSTDSWRQTDNEY